MAVKDGSTALPSLAAAALLAALGMAGGAAHGQLPAPPPTPGDPALLDSPAKAEDGRSAVVFFAYHSSLADPDPGRANGRGSPPIGGPRPTRRDRQHLRRRGADLRRGLQRNAPQQARLSRLRVLRSGQRLPEHDAPIQAQRIRLGPSPRWARSARPPPHCGDEGESRSLVSRRRRDGHLWVVLGRMTDPRPPPRAASPRLNAPGGTCPCSDARPGCAGRCRWWSDTRSCPSRSRSRRSGRPAGARRP